jgi:glycerophosphoryl diester phosphodiesterase
VCVGAFATRRIRAVRAQLGPGLCTSFGPAAVVSLRTTGRAFPRGAACVEVPASVGRLAVTDRRFLASAHRLGLPVIAYTVDVPAHMHRLLDLGVDGLMTDRADVLREVLIERGQWGP